MSTMQLSSNQPTSWDLEYFVDRRKPEYANLSAISSTQEGVLDSNKRVNIDIFKKDKLPAMLLQLDPETLDLLFIQELARIRELGRTLMSVMKMGVGKNQFLLAQDQLLSLDELNPEFTRLLEQGVTLSLDKDDQFEKRGFRSEGIVNFPADPDSMIGIAASGWSYPHPEAAELTVKPYGNAFILCRPEFTINLRENTAKQDIYSSQRFCDCRVLMLQTAALCAVRMASSISTKIKSISD